MGAQPETGATESLGDADRTAGCRQLRSPSLSLDVDEDEGANPARKVLSAEGEEGLWDGKAGSGLTWCLSRTFSHRSHVLSSVSLP